MKESESFTLILRAEPGNWRTSPVLRLRGALKTLLRAFGLRCLSVKPIDVTAGTQRTGKGIVANILGSENQNEPKR
jgi:hypothetical protein